MLRTVPALRSACPVRCCSSSWTIWSGFRARLGLETVGEVATPRRVFATALTTTVFNPAHDRALDDLAATKRPGPEPVTRADLFVLPGDRGLRLVALPLEVLEHGLGTGEEADVLRSTLAGCGCASRSRLIVA
jgi:hypothetical protein